jgi:hypothetical protein
MIEHSDWRSSSRLCRRPGNHRPPRLPPHRKAVCTASDAICGGGLARRKSRRTKYLRPPGRGQNPSLNRTVGAEDSRVAGTRDNHKM